MKLLITGGCGFLGSNLAANALRLGDELLVFDNLSRSGSIENLQWLQKQGSFKFVHGDIRNQNDVHRLIKEFQPDEIFHLAGQVAMTTSIANPRLDFEINALGTLNILEAVRQAAPEATVIYSSTNKVYGDLEQFNYKENKTRYLCVEHPEGFKEVIQLEFHSPYGCSKGAADQYVLDYARIFGLRTVVFRHSSMYGGRQFATYDQGWVGWFCMQAIEKKRAAETKPFSISGTGKQVRDVLHADDMVRLYFSVRNNIGIAAGNAFNIGGGVKNSLSLLELFEMIENLAGLKLAFIHLPPRESDQRTFIADIGKAKKYFNWQPQVTASEGVGRMLKWTEENYA